MKNNQFIKYKKWGFDTYTNLIFSYIDGFGSNGVKTSNETMCDILDIGKGALTKKLTWLEKEGYIVRNKKTIVDNKTKMPRTFRTIRVVKRPSIVKVKSNQSS